MGAAAAVALLVLGALINPIGQRVVDARYPKEVKPPVLCTTSGTSNAGAQSNQTSLKLLVRESSSSCYSNRAPNLVDGQDLQFVASWKNMSEKQQDNVSVFLELPKGMTLIPGTSYGANATNPDGLKLDGDITLDGINMGSYAANANFYITFATHFEVNRSMPCGAAKAGVFLSRIGSSEPVVRQTVPVSYTQKCAAQP